MITKENRATIVKIITAFFITWFGVPILVGLAPVVILLVVLAVIVLAFRIFDRSRDELLAIGIGLLLGFLANLVPQLNSSAIGGDLLVRAFLSLWLIYLI